MKVAAIKIEKTVERLLIKSEKGSVRLTNYAQVAHRGGPLPIIIPARLSESLRENLIKKNN